MHNCLAIKMRVVSFNCLRTVLSEYNGSKSLLRM